MNSFVKRTKIFFTFIGIIFISELNSCSPPEEPVQVKEDLASDENNDSDENTYNLGDNLSKGFMLDESNAFGSTVKCNGKSAKEFIPKVGENVSCIYKTLTLATFTNIQKKIPDKGIQISDADEFLYNRTRAANAISLIKTMAEIKEQTVEFNLIKSEELSFLNFYKNDLGISSEEFAMLIDQVNADKKTNTSPSSHDAKINEVTTEGPSNIFGRSDFISVNAEDNLIYIPSKVIITTGILTDNLSRKIEGVEYYTNSSRGKTNENGEFQFSWGEEIIFGIDTFELGKVRGNKTDFKLTDLASGHVGRNVERLIQRFGKITSTKVSVPNIVKETFAKYPNVINEIIKLSLSEKIILDLGTVEQTIEGEFLQQFEEGEAKEIDQKISTANASSRSIRNQVHLTFRSATKASNDDSGTILREIKKLWGINDGWHPVNHFHVFHDVMKVKGFNTGHHRGNARAQAAVYVSNNAFPVMMARNDFNYWIPFGEKAAFDELGLAFITEPPSTVIPYDVSGSNATFNLPFISIGKIGQGKVMLIGNPYYNSILVCPNGYIWDKGQVITDFHFIDSQGLCKSDNDSDDMKHFFQNTLRYLSASSNTDSNQSFKVGTNIPYVYFKHEWGKGNKAPFIINQASFNVTTEQLQSGDFNGLDPNQYPVLILNGFEYMEPSRHHYLIPMSADLSKPKLSEDDIDALMKYVERGGNILIMESIAVNFCDSVYGTDGTCKVNQWNPEPIGRLLDRAGLAVGHKDSVVLNGNGPNSENTYGEMNIRPRSIHSKGIWLIEKYPPLYQDMLGNTPVVEKPIPSYKIHDNGTVTWEYIERNLDPGYFKPKLKVASWEIGNKDSAEDWQVTQEKFMGNTTVFAFIEDRGQSDLEAQKKAILNHPDFQKSDGTPGYMECQNDNYHYEINCLEFRPTNGIEVWDEFNVPRYTELHLSEEVAKAMIQAGDLGTNIQRLYHHELYYRTKGKKGIRLGGVDVNRIYKNMTVWLWNNLKFTYDPSLEDEFGFKIFTEFLNCYSSNKHGGNTTCPESLKSELVKNNMIYGYGDYENLMNPSYPINFKEKPLTRLMLGRSYWDLNIKVDTRIYPGEPSSKSGGGGTFVLNFSGTGRGDGTGNLQSTGQWAVAHQEVTASVDTEKPVTIIVGLNDDLTAREAHEKRMIRPPRISKRFTLNNGPIKKTRQFTVPYGGLIYALSSEDKITLTLRNTIKAPWYRLLQNGVGEWVNSVDSPAPIGEIESKTFIYTAPKKNLKATNYNGDVKKLAEEFDTFSADLNDYYARDEGADGNLNRKITDSSIPNRKHRLVNDIAITIGVAHSGYPIMWRNFNQNSTEITQKPLNSLVLWHEVGHNTAEPPFSPVDGSNEVVANLGLYMQDKYLKKMKLVERNLRIINDLVESETNHIWGAVGANTRLLMFTQLKIWAEEKFDINDWYIGSLPSWYNQSEGMKGWNMFKLMHRLTRNKTDSDIRIKGTNQCYGQNLNANDSLMLCTSYVAQKDFTDFFIKWNPGSKANFLPSQTEPIYTGGITNTGKSAVKALNLPKPDLDPITINSL